jgi:hypothetical protein
MAYPPKPDIQTSYTAVEQALGDGSLPGQELDVDFANLKFSVDALNDFVRGITRSDGRLGNNTVTRDTLAADILLGLAPPAPWQAGREYEAPATVFEGNRFYIANTPHTSTVFADDLAAGRWVELADLSEPLAQFFERYIDVAASDPLTTPTGGPLVVGMLYYNTVEERLKAWNGSDWLPATGVTSLLRFRFVATSGQTVFTGNDADSNLLEFVGAPIQVHLNGVLLDEGTDFTTSGGDTVTLASGAAASDVLTVTAFRQLDFSQLPAQVAADATAASLSAAQAALFDGPWLDSQADIETDTTLTYAGGTPGTVAAGDYVRTRAEGFAYEVLASGAASPDRTTAGGVKLKVLAQGGVFYASAFGNTAAALQSALAAADGTAPLAIDRDYTVSAWSKFVPSGALTICGRNGSIVSTDGGEFLTVGGNTVVDGVTFSGWGSIIRVAETVDIEKFKFCNNTVLNTTRAIYWTAEGLASIGYTQAEITGNTFAGITEWAINIQPRRMEVTKISNNTLRDFLVPSGQLIGVKLGSQDFTGGDRATIEVSNNSFHNLFATAGNETNQIYCMMLHECDSYTVTGNIFRNIWKIDTAYITEIRAIHTRAGRGVIAGNTIQNVRGNGINTVDSINVASRDHIPLVEGNSITSDDGSDFIGIHMRTQDGAVVGNYIEGAGVGILGMHIQYSGTTRTHVYANNTIVNSKRCAIRLPLNRRGMQILGNKVSGVTGDSSPVEVGSGFTDTPSAIHIRVNSGTNSRNLNIADNLVQDIAGDAIILEGISDGEIRTGKISENVISGVTGDLFKLLTVTLSNVMFVENSVAVVTGSLFSTKIPRSCTFKTLGAASATLAGAAHNFTTSVRFNDVFYLTSSGSSRAVTGFAEGFNGREIAVFNANANGSGLNVALNHEASESLAENRILSPTGANVTLLPSQSARLIYDAGIDRWRIVGVSP